jgi:hypothetical protein
VEGEVTLPDSTHAEAQATAEGEATEAHFDSAQSAAVSQSEEAVKMLLDQVAFRMGLE